jgi:dTDP-4-dehydrorhamnose reductase
MRQVEVWGGIECSVVRISDRYVDQIAMSGHQNRIEDLERFAELGLRRIRYPVVWERVVRDGSSEPDWRWTDQRLLRLRDLGLGTIVGLLHHGSGPRFTSLADPSFAERFGEFAGRVAERYPWIDLYTPINEPLTTARFSGLYGHWYPHRRDDREFLVMLVNQVRATALAMAAIRRINPAARLVQTEDLGETHSTPTLRYQADHENERRWLSLDLLTGRVDRSHRSWPSFAAAGLSREVEGLQAAPCLPDIIGINHYLTSERFLDERLERYPETSWGGNERHRYADVEAVRVVAGGPTGPERLLRKAWERYGLPLAIAEVHNGSTGDEQLRWMDEIWQAACRLREDGVDIRAVTAWALLGSWEWNSLLLRRSGYYEPGAFDVRMASPRRTVVGKMIAQLARGEPMTHPALDTPGWWHRPDRFRWPPVDCALQPAPPLRSPAFRTGRPRSMLIAGAGSLGRAFARVCEARGLPGRLLDRRAFDIADPVSVRAGLALHRPWAVINTAGFTHVDQAEAAAERCRRENVEGAAILARACGERSIAFVSFSSDLVFDGEKGRPYVEEDVTCPINVYGASKADAEQAIAAVNGRALIIRSGALFGPWEERDFVAAALDALRSNSCFSAASDVVVSPTFVPDLTNATLDLLIDEESGIWHLANTGALSWMDFARELAVQGGLNPADVRGVPARDIGWKAPRPSYTVLGSLRSALMPTLDAAIGRYFGEVRRFSPR